MKKSSTIAALAGALAKAQGQFPAIERTAKVDFTTKSGAKIKYSYAPLPDIIKACKKPLSDNELSLMQHIWTRGKDEKVVIETVLCHSSGEWVSSSFTMTGNANDPQAMGSLITYGRRYGMSSILGISADEDDDALSQRQPDKPAQYKPQMKDGSPLNQPPEKPSNQWHWCDEHDTEFFKSPKMKSYAHLVKDKEGNNIYDENGKPLWCHEHREPEPPQSTEKPTNPKALGVIVSSKDKESLLSQYIDEEAKADLISSMESNKVTENWLFDYIVGKHYKKLTDKTGVFHYEFIEKEWLSDIYTAMEAQPSMM